MTEKAWSIKRNEPASDKQNFLANEVCYGLAIAAQMGFSEKETLDWIRDDLLAWSRKALPKGKK